MNEKERGMSEEQGHRQGVEGVVWDNLGRGWVMHCLCGWATPSYASLVDAADEMELHWDEVAA